MATQGIAAVRDFRDFSALFDRDRFGLDVRVGMTYFVALAVLTVTWMILPLIRGYDIGWNPATYYVLWAFLSAIESAALVWVLHTIEDPKSLLVTWGIVNTLLSAGMRFGLNLVAIEGWPQRPVLDPALLVSGFFYGALLLLGIVVAVREKGVTIGAFLVGAAAGLLAHAVLFEIAWMALRRSAGFDLEGPIGAVVDGLILGGLIYAGLAWHMRDLAAPVAAAAPAGAGAAGFAAAAQPTGPVATLGAGGSRQHWFVCCGNPFLITTFMEAYGVARAVGWGEFRRLRASVFGGGFEAAKQAAASAGAAFPGKEFMGEQGWDTSSLEQVMSQIQAGVSGEVHVAYGITTAAHADWMRSTYQLLVGEALEQGILPFPMYMTESEAAARALAGAFEEA